MTKKELTDRWLASNNKKVIKGDTNDGAALVPFLMMDCQYQIFCKHIKPLHLTREAQRVRNRWAQSYNALNKAFFASYEEEERFCAVDLMDDFEKFVSNDLTITFAQMTNLVSFLPFEEQIEVSACMLCNVLAQCAQIIWRTCILNSWGEGSTNRDIESVEKNSSKLMRMLFKSERDVNPNDDERVNGAIGALIKKFSAWLDN